MSKHLKHYQPPTHEEISACALRIYEMEGRPEGKAMEHWLQAEAQLTSERKAQVTEATPKAPKSAAKSTTAGKSRVSKAGGNWPAQPAQGQRIQHN